MPSLHSEFLYHYDPDLRIRSHRSLLLNLLLQHRDMSLSFSAGISMLSLFLVERSSLLDFLDSLLKNMKVILPVRLRDARAILRCIESRPKRDRSRVEGSHLWISMGKTVARETSAESCRMGSCRA